MRWLLRLYPRDWRRRYGPEMEAFLLQARPGPRDLVDLLRGALDARLHPQWRRQHGRPRRPARRRTTYGPPRPGRTWAGLALAAVLAVIAGHTVAVPLGAGAAPPPRLLTQPPLLLFSPMWLLPGLVVAGLAGAAALAAGRLGARLLAAFGALLALRYAADCAVLLVAQARLAALARPLLPLPVGVRLPVLLIALDVAQVALWGGVAVLLLRRTRLSPLAAFAAGCALDLVLGNTGLSLAALAEQPLLQPLPPLATPVPIHPGTSAPPPWLFLPGYLEPLRMALWAAAMAALTRLRSRRPGRDDEPPEGAPVSARPMPDPPEPLSAVSGGAGRRRAS